MQDILAGGRGGGGGGGGEVLCYGKGMAVRSVPREVWGHAPQEMFENRYSEMHVFL